VEIEDPADDQILAYDETAGIWKNIDIPAQSGNVIINGAFDIWQRGTSFTASDVYTADRWVMALSGATATTSRQAFTVGQTDVPNNPNYFLRLAVSVGDNAARLEHRIEDVTVSSNQTYTLSFWAKGTNPGGGVLEVVARQESGIGGSPGVNLSAGTITLTGSWQKFTKTFTYGSMSGKTLTSSSQFWGFDIRQPAGDTSTAAWTLDIANVQLESGPTATPFKRNAPSIQAELAACQRYYWRAGGDEAFQTLGSGMAEGGNIIIQTTNPVTMRTKPTSLEFSTLLTYDGSTTVSTSSASLGLSSRYISRITINPSSAPTTFRPYWLFTNNSLSGFIGFSAEL
jgi:hypothetical protein